MNCILCFDAAINCTCEWNMSERKTLGDKEVRKWFYKKLKPCLKKKGKIFLIGTPKEKT